MEKIAKAAIRYERKVYSMDPPARHHDIIGMLSDSRGGKTIIGPQGFVTDTGRFVLRGEAMTIAKAAGQLIGTPHLEHTLFSEDLW